MSEEYYDTEIAPKLAEIANLCKANGMSFFAAVEYEQPGEIGETRLFVPGYSQTMMQLSKLLSDGYTPPMLVTIERQAKEPQP